MGLVANLSHQISALWFFKVLFSSAKCLPVLKGFYQVKYAPVNTPKLRPGQA